MLKSIIIKNVQTHKKTIIKFHSGVNMFIGDSENGKSAIFNSLYKVISNRPLGDEWRSWWGGDSFIKLSLDDKNVIYKKGTKAEYIITDKNKRTPLKAIGNGPPPQDVVDLINMDTKINIQKQLERGVPIFLISEPPGDVAKFFNKVSGLYKIDTTIKEGKDDLKESEKEYETIKNIIKNKEDSLKEYDGIDVLLEKVKEAEKIQTTKEEISSTIIRIQMLLDKISTYKEKIQTKQKVLKIKNKVDTALQIQEQMKEINMRIFHTETLFEKIIYSKNHIKNYTKKLKTMPKINEALVALQNNKVIITKLNTLNTLKYKLNASKTKITRLSTNLEQTTVKFNKIMPDKCPLCGK